jgi:peptide/nickel transport system substrate-binding protein
VGLTRAPTSLDPGDHRDRQSETVIRNMFDGLVTRDTRNGVHLELAQALEWLDDRTLSVTLRRDVLFHDGTEMTAEDVVFTFDRLIQENAIEYPTPHTSPRRGLITPLEWIEKSGDYSVVMHFRAPWPPATQMLVHQQILPKHYLQAVGTQGFIAHPIGTGPFKFVSASSDLQEVVVERFEAYYGGAPDLPPVGPACVQRVVFRAIPGALVRAAALRAGELAIIQAVPRDLVATLTETRDIQVLTAPGTRPTWLELNITKPPFDDVTVRQALNYTIDKQRLIDEVYGGRAYALPGPLSPFNNSVDATLAPYTYDPERAASMLMEAGWTDFDGDGILDRQRRPFAITLDTLEEWGPLAEAVARQIDEMGITVIVRYWDRAEISPRLLARERMAYLDSWGDSAFDPVGHFEAKWHSTIEGGPYGRANYSGFANPRVDELIQLGETTADPQERQRIYSEAQRIIYEAAPAVFLILPEEVEAASLQVQNWEPASDGRINLHDVCLAPRVGE